MAGAAATESAEKRCIEAIKKVYAVSDAVYDVATDTIGGEDRETILSLLTEARNLALDCGCLELVDKADEFRILAAGKPTVQKALEQVAKLKEVAKKCMELAIPAES